MHLGIGLDFELDFCFHLKKDNGEGNIMEIMIKKETLN